jgi:hypothetical protein
MTGSPVDGPGFELELLGLKLRVTGEDPGFLRELAAYYETASALPAGSVAGEPATAAPAAAGHAATVSEASDLLVRLCGRVLDAPLQAESLTTDPPDAFGDHLSGVPLTPQSVASAINSWAASTASSCYAFHGGAVARGERGILLLAGSYQGKSSLTAALVRHGFDLLSDEVAAVDAVTGVMVPFPRVVLLRSDVLPQLGIGLGCGRALEDGAVRALSAADLGGGRSPGGFRPSMIVQPTFAAGREVMVLRLEPARAFELLQRTSCNASAWGERGFDAMVKLARDLSCHRVFYSHTGQAVDAIERLMC